MYRHRKFTDLMHKYIEEATKRGLYVLVDWHQQAQAGGVWVRDIVRSPDQW